MRATANDGLLNSAPVTSTTVTVKLTVVAPLWFVAALFATPAAWWLFRGRHSARLADEMD